MVLKELLTQLLIQKLITSIKVAGNRILLLNAINDSENVGQTVGETPYTYSQYDGPMLGKMLMAQTL